jgi:hypothetical protein
MTMRKLGESLAQRADEDERLYSLYGKPLESDHMGDFVAIGPSGECIIGADRLLVAKEALRRFGAGQFALRRVGCDYEGRILGLIG